MCIKMGHLSILEQTDPLDKRFVLCTEDQCNNQDCLRLVLDLPLRLNSVLLSTRNSFYVEL
jgi:hypothetical protein